MKLFFSLLDGYDDGGGSGDGEGEGEGDGDGDGDSGCEGEHVGSAIAMMSGLCSVHGKNRSLERFQRTGFSWKHVWFNLFSHGDLLGYGMY